MAADKHEDFHRAGKLYRDGHYRDALELYDSLNRVHRDSKHLAYARGKCLVALDRIPEATALLRKLQNTSGNTAQQLAARLADKLAAHEVASRAIAGTGSENSASGEPAHFEKPVQKSDRRLRPDEDLRKWVCCSLAVAAIAVAIVVAAIRAAGSRPLPEHTGIVGPDTPMVLDSERRYLELTHFPPTDGEQPFCLAVYLRQFDPAEDYSPQDLEDCLGSSVARSWTDLRPQLEGAVVLSAGAYEKTGGVDSGQLLRIFVVPAADTALPPGFDTTALVTFERGAAQTLPEIAAYCGEPLSEEDWQGQGLRLNLRGPVYWWGRSGVALGTHGNVSHFLLRTHPDEISETERLLPNPAAKLSDTGEFDTDAG